MFYQSLNKIGECYLVDSCTHEIYAICVYNQVGKQVSVQKTGKKDAGWNNFRRQFWIAENNGKISRQKKTLCFVMYMIHMKKLLTKRSDECNFDNYPSEKSG